MNTDKRLLLQVALIESTGTIPNLGIPNRKLVEVCSLICQRSRESGELALPQTLRDGCALPCTAGGSEVGAIIAAIPTRNRPNAREKGQQAQNLRAVAVDRSGHLVRKYPLSPAASKFYSQV